MVWYPLLEFYMFGSKIIDFLNTIADWILLSLLFFIGGLFIVTIPTAFTAVCHVMSKVMMGGRGAVASEFVKAYLYHLKRTIIMSLVYICTGLVLIVPLYCLYPLFSGLFIFQTYEISVFFLCMFSIVIGLRILALMAVKDISWRESLAGACILLKKPIQSMVLLIFTLLMLFVDIMYPPVLCITPSMLAWVTLKTSSLVVSE